jgi:hypothetical protein
MTTITDEQMRALLPTLKPYTLVIVKSGPNRRADGADAIIWEHARRNLELRADGVLSIVCPVGTDAVAGIYIFGLGVEETREVMRGDPAVAAGVLAMDAYTCRGFPGDALR